MTIEKAKRSVQNHFGGSEKSAVGMVEDEIEKAIKYYYNGDNYVTEAEIALLHHAFELLGKEKAKWNRHSMFAPRTIRDDTL